MAYSKKKRGFREITVNGVTYRWRVGREHFISADTVTLQGPISSGQQLIYYLRSVFVPTQWDDEGKAISGGFTPHPNAPVAITPRFVRQAILYGLEHGWTPDKRANALWIEWNKTMFDADLPHPLAPSPPGGEGETGREQVPSPLDGEGI